ncbi:MAG: hypothetical protein JRI82_16110, partial [Deltaproteobacteria bacterium]|nr:hypothetical protein [Deltaproteobacteria bacterium]
ASAEPRDAGRGESVVGRRLIKSQLDFIYSKKSKISIYKWEREAIE